MNARQITQDLHGQWFGRYGSAPCPVCQPEGHKGQNALTLSNAGGKLLAHCKKTGCAFTDILAAAGVTSGDYAAPDPVQDAQRRAKERADAERRAMQAHNLWQDAQPIGGTLAERYLRGRGITCTLPPTLRFHPQCWHPQAKRLPAMLALVEGVESFAVHRTYLAHDGNGKAAVDPAKMMLGGVMGGAVRLGDARGPLVVAEGIETAMSLCCGLLSGPATVWAALSTSGMCGLRLPTHPSRMTIASDGDAPGKTAASALAERASALGWQVSLLSAPEGRDWNDILILKGQAA